MRTLSQAVINGLLLATAIVVLAPKVARAVDQLLVPVLIALAVFIVVRLIWRTTML